MILDGKKISNEIIESLKLEIEKLQTKPKVIDLLIGNNESSKLYSKNKLRACKNIGIDFEVINFDETEEEKDIINYIERVNNDNKVTAIMVQLPIPIKFNKDNIINSISPNKDVDGLTKYNQTKLYNNEEFIIPCTPKGILKMLNYYNIELVDKNVVVIGKSDLVGKPISHLLLQEKANVIICDSKTENLSTHTKSADIIISATNISGLITGNMLNSECIVIDAGMTYKDGKFFGNITDEAKNKVKGFTPVPGGVGPMTVAMFLENILICYNNKNRE